jgi:hypothetical protein
MGQKSITKDELYLLKLFYLAEKMGDVSAEVDRYTVGKAIGQNDKSVDNIVRMLAQTNFIKKGEGNAVFLTPQGQRYVTTLQEQS